MLVSIVIPIHNVEIYLKRCLQSVSDQTYKKIEIILVDDGSTDNSGSMCDDFAQKDRRAIVIHKENGGLSSARNAGTAIARGEYITFLDSDDYLAPDFVEKTLSMCEDQNAQIAILDMKYIKESVNEYIGEKRAINTIEMDSERAIEESLYQKHFSCCAPAKMYKKEIAQAIMFPVGRLSEDLATCHLLFDRADKIVYINEIGYYYRQRDNSIMHEFKIDRMDALAWAKDIEMFCKARYPAIVDASICRLFNVAVHLLLDIPKDSKMRGVVVPDLMDIIKKTRCKVIINSKSRMREKIAATLSFLGEPVLRWVWDSRFAKRKDK